MIIETKEIVERTAYEDDFLDSAEKIEQSIILTKEQLKAIGEINNDLNEMSFKTRLLQGVTGSENGGLF